MENKALLERIKKAEQGIWEEPHHPFPWKALTGTIISVGSAIAGMFLLLLPALERLKEDPNMEESTKGFLGILPYLFVAIILLGTIGWMAWGPKKEGKTEE